LLVLRLDGLPLRPFLSAFHSLLSPTSTSQSLTHCHLFLSREIIGLSKELTGFHFNSVYIFSFYFVSSVPAIIEIKLFPSSEVISDGGTVVGTEDPVGFVPFRRGEGIAFGGAFDH